MDSMAKWRMLAIELEISTSADCVTVGLARKICHGKIVVKYLQAPSKHDTIRNLRG
jgi:hypothetical protein